MHNRIYVRLEYFYIIRHKISGMFYAGSKYANKGHCHPDAFWNKDHIHGYFTCSSHIKKLIQTDGIDSFEIIEIIPRPMNDAREYEARFLMSFNAAKHDKWINKHNGNANFMNTPESVLKQSAAIRGVEKSAEHKAAISKSLTGRKQSKLTIEKRVAKNKGKQRSEEFKANLSKRMTGVKTNKGKIWINNGIESIMIDFTDSIPSGFIRGRIKTW